MPHKTAKDRQAPSLAYRYQDAIYMNITARCPTACDFCIKFSWEYRYRGHNLLLEREPKVAEILKAVGDPARYSEAVFCGYGESTYRLKEMAEISRGLRTKGAKRIRLNTIGLGSLIQGRDIVPDLAEIVDAVSVSLNTADPKKWVEIHRPRPEFRAGGYRAVLDFIRASARAIPDTTVTAVDGAVEDPAGFCRLAESLGARARIRPILDAYEDR